MNNPFTTTFSKIPSNSYIETDELRDIITNFSYEDPSESVYKLTGVRGSGKTVLLSKIEEDLKRVSDKWIIYNLSSSRDLLNQLVAFLYKDKYIKIKNKEKQIGINLSILGNGGGFNYANKKEDYAIDVGVEIEEGLKEIKRQNKKLLIGIDEVMKNKEMVQFASEFGKWLISQYSVYLVCTGLYENVNQLSNVKNLTFFRRATTIKTNPLNVIRMTEMYKNKLGINHDIAIKLATMTKGYAYAFQKLGVLYFNKTVNETLIDIENALKTELYAYSYEKIWEELSEDEKFLLRLLTKKEINKRSDVIRLMGKKGSNYSVYRDRLIKKGLIITNNSNISLTLPYFANYVKEYCC